MKNTFTLFLICCLPFFCAAQLSRGVSTFGGSMEVNSNVTSLYANYGRFVSDHFLLGSGFNSLYTGNIFFDYAVIGIHPYARYYFSPKKENAFLFLQTDYQYSQFLLDAEGNTSGFGARLGLDYFIAPGVSVNTMAGVNFGGNSEDALSLTIGLDAFILPLVTEGGGSTIGQFQKGSFIIGESTIGLSRSLNIINWNLNVNPRVGYFFTNKLVAGAEISFTVNKYKGELFGDFSGSLFNISPFARYYLNFPKRFNPFVALEINYNLIDSNSTGNENRSNLNSIKGGLGSNFFLTPNLALEGILNIEHNNFNQNTRLTFEAGVQYFIH